jgi:hypothetical protein
MTELGSGISMQKKLEPKRRISASFYTKVAAMVDLPTPGLPTDVSRRCQLDARPTDQVLDKPLPEFHRTLKAIALATIHIYLPKNEKKCEKAIEKVQ